MKRYFHEVLKGRKIIEIATQNIQASRYKYITKFGSKETNSLSRKFHRCPADNSLAQRLGQSIIVYLLMYCEYVQ